MSINELILSKSVTGYRCIDCVVRRKRCGEFVFKAIKLYAK